MRFVMFCHSLVSCWNHGNAHFLRGVATELLARGHELTVYEPRDGWSRRQLELDHGRAATSGYRAAYPALSSVFYDTSTLDVEAATEGADVVIVHEWASPLLVARLSRHRRQSGRYRLLFHDTHHRAVTNPGEIARYDLAGFDGVLAYGNVIAQLYRSRGLRAWTWHEAADARVFRPQERTDDAGDLVWIGNWGDGERSDEITRFLLEPVRRLSLRARVHGVRYPKQALRALERCGVEYGGWLANHLVPQVFARYRMTVHIPRLPYREAIPGVPTIRMFEALACGIPLVSLRWEDLDGLFRPGIDYLVVETPRQMEQAISRVLADEELAHSLSRHGLETIRARHTCSHRVEELLEIVEQLDRPEPLRASAPAVPSRSPGSHERRPQA